MSTYYVNEAAFALPDWKFVDRTVHMLESPLAGDVPLSIAIRRLPIPEGTTLRALVEGEVATTTAKTKGFTVIDEEQVSVADTTAILIRARCRFRDVAHYQRQAHFAYDDTWIALVVAGPHADRAACDETFDRIVHSLTWRTG
jgi:hypothetical protein